MKILSLTLALSLVLSASAFGQLFSSNESSPQYTVYGDAVFNDTTATGGPGNDISSSDLMDLDQTPNSDQVFVPKYTSFTVGGIVFTYVPTNPSSIALDAGQTITVEYYDEDAGDANDFGYLDGTNEVDLFTDYSVPPPPGSTHWEITSLTGADITFYNRHENDPIDTMDDSVHFVFYEGYAEDGTKLYLIFVDDLEKKNKDWNNGIFLVAVPEPETYMAFGMLSLLALMGARFRNRRRAR